MKKVNLIDGSFAHQQASSLGGECAGEKPKRIEWDRSLMSPGALVLTDMLIRDVEQYSNFNPIIGWLIEPPSLSDKHYKDAVRLMDKFERILTFRKDLIEQYPDKFLYYPFGGSWIPENQWHIYSKTKMVSMIASQKIRASGHKMRHAIIKRFPQYAHNMDVDVMGYGYEPIATKLTGLADYRYSIVVESCQCDDYFSEKLIDCFACGTVPIYWGSKNIYKYFDPRGMLRFQTISGLENIIIQVVGEHDYYMRMEGIKANMQAARKYRVAEDWIDKCYQFLF